MAEDRGKAKQEKQQKEKKEEKEKRTSKTLGHVAELSIFPTGITSTRTVGCMAWGGRKREREQNGATRYDNDSISIRLKRD